MILESDWSPDLVLSEDGLSLREKTDGELKEEASAIKASAETLRKRGEMLESCREDHVFSELVDASPDDIIVFVDDAFPDHDAIQKAAITFILKSVMTSLRSYG